MISPEETSQPVDEVPLESPSAVPPSDPERGSGYRELPQKKRPQSKIPSALSSTELDKIPDRSQRSKGQEAKYLTVRTNCPSCGKRLSARIDMLKAKLKCPGCEKRLHLGKDGEWRVGERPAETEYDPYISEAKTVKRPAWWRKTAAGKFLIEHWRRVLLVLGGVCLIALAAVLVQDRSETVLPEPLEQRAEIALRAALSGDSRTLSRLTLSETQSQSREWSREIRKSAGKITDDRISHTVVFANRAKGTATTLATLTPSGAPKKELLLHWKLDDQKLWRLDGDRTKRER